MPDLPIPGLPASRKTPAVYMAVVLGGAGVSPGAAPRRLMLLGNMLAVALTGVAPVFTVPVGLQQSGGVAIETRLQVFSADDALTKFGQGSELHRMARAVFSQYPEADLWATPVAEAAGVKATATLTLTGTATASIVLRAFIAGVTIEIPITTGDSAATLATRLATATVAAFPDLPVTAQAAAGVVTWTAKHNGFRGNELKLAAEFSDGGTLTLNVGTVAVTTSGVTATLGALAFAGGTGTDSPTNALASFATERFHLLACAQSDTANILLISDDLDAKAGVTTMLWGQLVSPSIKSPASATTDAAAINRPRVQLVNQESAPLDGCTIAAQVAAGRLIGDAIVGGTTLGESLDPAANLNGLQLRDVQAQRNPLDFPSGTEVESMLNAGVAPLVPDPGRPGFVQLVASITTRHKDSSAALNYAVWKTKAVTVSDFIAETVKRAIDTTYKKFKLRADPPEGQVVKVPRVVTPSMIRSFVLALLKNQEEEGVIANVDDHAGQLVAQINGSNPQRIDLTIPEFPIPDLDIVAARVDQLTG